MAGAACLITIYSQFLDYSNTLAQLACHHRSYQNEIRETYAKSNSGFPIVSHAFIIPRRPSIYTLNRGQCIGNKFIRTSLRQNLE